MEKLLSPIEIYMPLPELKKLFIVYDIIGVYACIFFGIVLGLIISGYYYRKKFLKIIDKLKDVED